MGNLELAILLKVNLVKSILYTEPISPKLGVLTALLIAYCAHYNDTLNMIYESTIGL